MRRRTARRRRPSSATAAGAGAEFDHLRALTVTAVRHLIGTSGSTVTESVTNAGAQTRARAADLLGTPPRFVRRLIVERRIRFYKLGRYVRIDRTDVESFIAASRVEAALVRSRQRRA